MQSPVGCWPTSPCSRPAPSGRRLMGTDVSQTSMEIVRGDLIRLALDGVFDVVVHGCNCQCVMGAGVAKAIRTAFPAAFEADRATARGDRGKLGTFSSAQIASGGRLITVVNAYTQFHWRGRKPLADYEAIRKVFGFIRSTFSGRRIGYPKIGAGLAGGDWPTIAAIIDDALKGEVHKLVEYAG